jgi:hypothetical protein
VSEKTVRNTKQLLQEAKVEDGIWTKIMNVRFNERTTILDLEREGYLEISGPITEQAMVRLTETGKEKLATLVSNGPLRSTWSEFRQGIIYPVVILVIGIILGKFL